MSAASARGSVLFAGGSASTQIKDPNYANNASVTSVALGAADGHVSALARVTVDPREVRGHDQAGRR